MTSSDLLSIYLRDHHAGAVAGHELAKRSAKSNQGTPFAPVLQSLEQEIGEDRKALEDIMGRLGIQPAKSKDVAAWTAEKLGRLKLNGSLTKYSPLSRVLELEGLMIGVQGKKGLWKSLQQLEDPRVGTEELASLEARADEQQRRIEETRLDAARIALGAGSM
jgi:hypothetical protein